MTPEWRVTVRLPDGTRGEQIRDWSALDLDARLMGAGGRVGQLRIDVPASHRAASDLLEPGAGLILEALPAAGRVEWSGDVVDAQWTSGRAGRVSVIAEADDALWRDSVALPSPTVDISTTATSVQPASHDVRTGPAETVALAYMAANIGPAAGITRRRYSWLVLPTSVGRGGTVTYRARMQTLLEIVQQVLVPAGLAARVVHKDTGQRAVEVWAPAQPAAARYSVAAGSVRDLTWHVTAPIGTDWTAGGQGEDTARDFTRLAQPSWGRFRRERFVDVRASEGFDELRAAIDARVAEDVATEQVTWRLVPTGDAARFGVDLHVGDLVEVSIPGRETPVVDVVRQVQMRIDRAGEPPVITVTAGWPDADPEQTTIARVRADVAAIVRS